MRTLHLAVLLSGLGMSAASAAAPAAAPNPLETKLRANLDKGETLLLRSSALKQLIEIRKGFPKASFTWSRDSNVPTDLLVQGKPGDRTITLSFDYKAPAIEKADEAGNLGAQAKRYQTDLCHAVRDFFRAGYQHGFGGSFRAASPLDPPMAVWGPLDQSPVYQALDADGQTAFAAAFQAMDQVVAPEEISTLAIWLHALQVWLPKTDASGNMVKLPKADSEFFFSATMNREQASRVDWANLDGMDPSAFGMFCDCQIFRLLDPAASQPAADGSAPVNAWQDVQVLE